MTINGKFPADDGNERVTVWVLPAGKLKGLEGEVLLPPGKPEIATLTGPANPLIAVVDTLNVEFEVPAMAVTVDGETLRAKS